MASLKGVAFDRATASSGWQGLFEGCLMVTGEGVVLMQVPAGFWGQAFDTRVLLAARFLETSQESRSRKSCPQGSVRIYIYMALDVREADKILE